MCLLFFVVVFCVCFFLLLLFVVFFCFVFCCCFFPIIIKSFLAEKTGLCLAVAKRKLQLCIESLYAQSALDQRER